MSAAFNPRYAAYARAHGKTPEAMMQGDAAALSGGSMVGFILWISKQKRQFAALHPDKMMGDSVLDQEAWTEFLNAVADKQEDKT